MPGVTVSIRNQATGIVRDTVTDAKGLFRAPLLPVGTYEVTASLSGFATTKRANLELTIGQTLTADLSLKVAGTREEVTVTAETPVIEAARTYQASSVHATAVANLPVNGRNFIDFVLTTPGVTRDTRGGDISFAGQRGVLNSLVIDGADNNNTFFGQTLGRTGSGRAPYQFSQDAVQEFVVNRNAYSAEYGRAGGAVINVVTKSGTNDLHGSAVEFYRDKSLNANSYNNKIRTPIAARSPFRIHQFGASLGGPIQKDKAFFFASYDGQRRSIPNPVILTLPANLPTDPDTARGLALVQSKTHDYVLTRDTRGGDISFAGQRGVLNSLVIDGADNNNTFFGQTLGRTGSGRAPYQFSQDAVQEFVVNRNAYSAEYGRAGGAVINVVTKSGTNDLHGSAFEF
ncbi:MAG TPA: carboxypeptidase regulatory-like domain-containing protein, partial [Kribbellaceae bacterium]